jgi:hypothetical protein
MNIIYKILTFSFRKYCKENLLGYNNVGYVYPYIKHTPKDVYYMCWWDGIKKDDYYTYLPQFRSLVIVYQWNIKWFFKKYENNVIFNFIKTFYNDITFKIFTNYTYKRIRYNYYKLTNQLNKPL